MALETNLNVSPYFDDFNEDKNFHRVLFRPGYAVQARELTQMQTILQNQVERFANRVVHDGKIISGCSPKVGPIGYVKLRDKDAANNRVLLLGDFYSQGAVANLTIRGETSGVTAQLVDAKEGSEAAAPNYLSVFVKYNDSGSTGESKTFADNEQLIFNTSTGEFKVAANTVNIGATGTGLRATVTDGVIYHKGHFVRVDSQGTIFEKYSTTPTKKLGFETRETIVDSNADASLLDNASGSTNYSAPGATRLKMTPVLSSRAIDSANTSTFFSIAYVEEGLITRKVNDNLGGVDVTLAERIGEIHGNFATKPFNVRIREHKKADNNLGRYDNGDINKVVAEIDPSIGYVGGNRIELQQKVFRSVDKATDKEVTEDRVLTTSLGNYVICDEVVGSWDLKNLDQIDLYDAAQGAITDGNYSSHAVTGTKVGTARVRGIEYHSGVSGRASGQFRIYLFRINMNAGKSFANDVKGLYAPNSGGAGTHSFADPVLVSSKAVLKETEIKTLVYPFAQRATAVYQADTDPSSDALTNAQFVYRTEKDATVANQAESIAVGSGHTGGTEQLNETGEIGDTLETEFVIVSTSPAETTNKSGTITVSGTSVSGSGTAFTTDYVVGDHIMYSTYTARIASITDNDTMTLTTSAGNATGVAHHKLYKKGHIFDFSGTFRNLTASGSTVSLDFGEEWSNSFSIKMYANVLRTGAVKAMKDVRKNRYVHINTTTHTDTNSGTYSLGVPDAYKLVTVYKGSASGVSTSDEDVTKHFELDTAQEDGFYGISRLVKKPTSTLDLTDVGLLVKFNYFERNTVNGVGFFSADSYPVKDSDPSADDAILTQEIPVFISPTTGKSFDLRDSIDYRPLLQATATPSTTGTAAAAPTNPAAATAATNFDIATEAFVPSPDENFQCDGEYYLPRKDRIVMTKEGTIEVVKGISATNPRPPAEKAGSMTLASLDIPPYPSLSPYVGRIYNRTEYTVKLSIENNRRYTMKDLRSVESRVKNLEYYSSLNALESSAKNKQLFNTNGQDRYKNGFLVDNFDGHNLADPTKEGYRASIDRNRTQLRPTFDRVDVPLQYNSGFTGTSNVVKKGNLVMLAHTSVDMTRQQYASKLRNPVQEISFAWNGQITIDPPVDNTPDITQLPELQIDFDGMYQAMEFIAEKTGITGIDFGNWTTTSVSRTTTSSGDWDTQTTQTNQIRNGLQTTVSPSSSAFDLGDMITNVAVSDYMRSRVVRFTGHGMRPNTRVYPYFGDEIVTDYCTPSDGAFANTAPQGSPLTTNDRGVVYGHFRIPADESLRFTVGTHRFTLRDVSDYETQADLVTTSAHGDYTSIPLDVDVRATSVNIVTPQFSSQTVTENRTLTSTRTWFTGDSGDGGDGDPLAQSFTVSAGDSDGVFVTKMDLFFGKKSATAPITLMIREIENGVPTNIIVPNGSKTLDPADINVNPSSASTPTEFEFDTPVFLQNNKDYCFVLKPTGNDTNYALWTAELGKKDVDTNQLIDKPPHSGVMMVSSNDKSWDNIQKEDVKFNMYKAEFTTNAGTAYIENEDVEFLTIGNITGTFQVGEKVSSGAKHGYVHFYDPGHEKLYLVDSTGNFADLDALTGSVSGATCDVISINNTKMNVGVPKLPSMIFSDTSIVWKARTTDSSGISGEYKDLSVNEENHFNDTEKVVYSDSNSSGLTQQEGSTKTFVARGIISTEDKNVSPVIDTSRLNMISVHNIINNDSDEEWKDVGNAAMRYMTKPVTLTDGNDAEDLKVFVTAYKPATTDVKVYARIHNPADSETLDQKDWTPLTQFTSLETVSDSANKDDFKEFEFGFSANTDGQGFLTTANSHARLNTSDDEVVYYRAQDGSVHNTYKTFAIKIVMTAQGSNLIPLCRDMRAIALQK